MIQGKWFAPASSPEEAFSIRDQVFHAGRDSRDDLSWNVVVYQDDVPAASGRLWWRDGSFWLGDLGVLPAFRGKMLGDLTLRLLLFKAQDHAAREVRLACPPDVTGFFARLGLKEQPSDGSPLVEMMIPGDEIDLDTCKNCPKSSCPNRK